MRLTRRSALGVLPLAALSACGRRAVLAPSTARASPTVVVAPSLTTSPAVADAPPLIPTPTAALTATPVRATALPTATAIDRRGQSGRVPPGFPTPDTASEALAPGGPPRDPGSLAWAHPGPYLPPARSDLSLRSFSSTQRLVTTYYFYWHDFTNARPSATQAQFDRPPDPAHYSFLLPETHKRQFQDMLDAGMDFALPVYWGEPGHPGRTTAETSPHYWSTEGIPPMVTALDQLRAAGAPLLQLGMFYDTTILANADLTTASGKEYFYINVRDFYSRLPPRYWAAIGNRPIVWLYDTLWVARFDQASIDYLGTRFVQDFAGLRPYLVLESQWRQSKLVTPPQKIRADAFYGWGAAPNGYDPDPALTVAEVGPGFRNTSYCRGGPAQNCFDIDRRNGAYYEQQLTQAVASSRRILAVETWNEFSEGTDVCETVQYGRQYVNLTRRYADQFKASG
jgi:hypothetical protein